MEIKEAIQTLRTEGFSVQQIGNYAKKGYRELMDLVYNKLRSMDSQNIYHYLEELYTDSLIYSKSGETEPKMYKQGYKLSNEKIEFVGSPIEVKKEIEFIVMKEKSPGLTRQRFSNNKVNKEVNKMEKEKAKVPCCEDLVNELITNAHTKFTEEDKEWLLTMEETQLGKLIPEKVKEVEKEPIVNVESEKVVTEVKVKEAISTLSAEDQAALAYGRKQLKERREKMIKGIQDNAGSETFPDTVLNAYDEDILERVFKAVTKEEVADYSLKGDTTQFNTSKIPHLYPAGIEINAK